MILPPPCTGEFESFLDDVSMSAFDLAGADGEFFGDGVRIVELSGTVLDVEVSGLRRLFVLAGFDMEVGLEGFHDLVYLSGFTAFFLTGQPGVALCGGANGSCGGQVVTEMIEVNQIMVFGAKLTLELFGDPRGTVAQSMNMRMFRQSDSKRQLLERLPCRFGIAKRDGESGFDRLRAAHQREARLFPERDTKFASVDALPFV